MKTQTVAALATLAALALPATAAAGLPKASDLLIVPSKSIGGVALGAKPSAVTKAWGKNKECEYQCHYEGAPPANGTAGFGNVLLESKTGKPPFKVWQISIALPSKLVGTQSRPVFDSPLTSFRTSKGIGLGSKESELKAAYHGLKKVPTGGGYVFFELPGPGEKTTLFVLQSGHRITSITVESHRGG